MTDMERLHQVILHGSSTLNLICRKLNSFFIILEKRILSLIETFFYYSEDMYAQDSIDLLTNSGIQFKKHEEDGIDPLEFAEILMTSGIVLMDNIKWLSFHSGYDFGYLLKLLTDQNLPQEEADFFELLKIYFPVIYDIKVQKKANKHSASPIKLFLNK